MQERINLLFVFFFSLSKTRFWQAHFRMLSHENELIVMREVLTFEIKSISWHHQRKENFNWCRVKSIANQTKYGEGQVVGICCGFNVNVLTYHTQHTTEKRSGQKTALPVRNWWYWIEARRTRAALTQSSYKYTWAALTVSLWTIKRRSHWHTHTQPESWTGRSGSAAMAMRAARPHLTSVSVRRAVYDRESSNSGPACV